MKTLPAVFEKNRLWAEQCRETSPDFFTRLEAQQDPDYLWIGCSDSRVPANEIVGMLPGELFVHRNIANLVVHTDMNALSVLQFAVDVLKVKHVIVCGHYGCGGVKAAMEEESHGLVDNWLRHVRDTYVRRQVELDGITDKRLRLRRLCELNVIEQVMNVGSTTILFDAWARGQSLSIHGWIYALSDGLLRDLDVCISSRNELEDLQKAQNEG